MASMSTPAPGGPDSTPENAMAVEKSDEIVEIGYSYASVLPDVRGRGHGQLALPAGNARDYADNLGAFLGRYESVHTTRAYKRGIESWLAWCLATGVHFTAARRSHVDTWARTLTGGSSKINQCLAAVSAWYEYLIANDLAETNPAAGARRRKATDTILTPGVTDDETAQLLNAAHHATGAMHRRNLALLGTYITTAARSSEPVAARIGDLGYNDGHRTLTVTRKGGKRVHLVVTATLGTLIDDWLDQYAGLLGYANAGDLPDYLPLFGTRTGKALDQSSVLKLVKRTAESAGIRNWRKIQTHSLRVGAVGRALDQRDLEDVQDWVGHADPKTTRRYDRRHKGLDKSPTYAIGGLLDEAIGVEPHEGHEPFATRNEDGDS